MKRVNEVIKTPFETFYISKDKKRAYSFAWWSGDEYALRNVGINIHHIMDYEEFKETKRAAYCSFIKRTGYFIDSSSPWNIETMNKMLKVYSVYNRLYKRFKEEPQVKKVFEDRLTPNTSQSHKALGEYSFLFGNVEKNEKRFSLLIKYCNRKY